MPPRQKAASDSFTPVESRQGLGGRRIRELIGCFADLFIAGIVGGARYFHRTAFTNANQKQTSITVGNETRVDVSSKLG